MLSDISMNQFQSSKYQSFVGGAEYRSKIGGNPAVMRQNWAASCSTI